MSVKTIHRLKCIEYFSTEQPNARLYRSNILRIVNMVFEVDKYHIRSNTLTRRVRANTLLSRRIQPSTHSSPILAICTSVEVLKNEV